MNHESPTKQKSILPRVKVRKALFGAGLALALVAGAIYLPPHLVAEDGAKIPVESPFRVPEHEYIGVKGCKTCHKKDKLGGVEYLAWEKLAHAKAYETLASDKAKAIAKERGIADAQKAPECLKCHTTAYGVDKKWRGKNLTLEEGVSCEACHGPGDDYKGKTTMKDRALSIEKGMVLPNETTCVACHNEESPTYREFDYKKHLPKIKHWKDKTE